MESRIAIDVEGVIVGKDCLSNKMSKISATDVSQIYVNLFLCPCYHEYPLVQQGMIQNLKNLTISDILVRYGLNFDDAYS